MTPATSHLDDAAASACLDRALAALVSLQRSDGHWCGELEGDSILESEYLLMKFILGQERQPMQDGRDGWETLSKIANYLRSLQREDGGWGQFPGAAIDLSATVKAYFALKLMGDPPGAPHMRSAREVVVKMGGAERCNSFSNFYLACLGQISWDAVPAIPPELVWLPRWFYFHMTKISAWTRTMILPLSIVATLRPVRRPPLELGIDELFVDHHARHRLKLVNAAPPGWRRFFLALDRAMKIGGRLVGRRGRGPALRSALKWILERAGQDGVAATAGLGAIFPPMVYIQVALQAMGYERSNPVVQRAERELDEFFIEEEFKTEVPAPPASRTPSGEGASGCDSTPSALNLKSQISNLEFQISSPEFQILIPESRISNPESQISNLKSQVQNPGPVQNPTAKIRIQPCFSPVWDTGIALYALADCGRTVRDEPARRAARWLLEKECRHVGDWADNLAREVRELPAFGWYFEYKNGWYPDCDDTAMVAMALKRIGGAENIDAARRGVDWLLAMQNDDGGWAAFDKTKHRQVLEYIPFADHNAMQDPSCPDITGRVLECLSWHGFTNEHPSVRRAIEYVKAKQEPEGCWFGRWGVNYIYGTWQAVIGPIRCGEDPRQGWIQKAGAWMKSIQQADGSFGESANSYEDRAQMGRGPSTASQTAWGAMVLQEIFGPRDGDLRRALAWLVKTQLRAEGDGSAPSPEGEGWGEGGVTSVPRALSPDNDPPGSWYEPWFTGTGFPRVFYLRYHLYRLYFPAMALGRYLAAQRRTAKAPLIETEPRRATVDV